MFGGKYGVKTRILIACLLPARRTLREWEQASEPTDVRRRAVRFAAPGSGPGSVSRMGQVSFRVNSPTVVSETVDREVVMIHLDTGNYYSLRSTGALIWDALEHGATVESITSALGAASHNGSDVGAVVSSFVHELMTEELIVPSIDPPSSSSATIELSPDPFEPPVLEKYTDMQHLILLDPVHEVDEGEGWPRPRDDA